MTSIGQRLREEREARNISLEEIASATKIVPRYLEALESDRLDLMPGGFFIKGIIRAYAKAVGLDPVEVLGRYRDAGLLEPAEPGGPPFQKPVVPPPTLPHAEPAPVVASVPSVEIEVPAGSSPPETGRAEPALVFEEAPKPGISPEARKKILSWVLRGFAGLLVLGVAVILWSPWRHRPAPVRTETPVTEAKVPPAPKTEAPSGVTTQAEAPAQAPGAAGETAPQPAAAKPEAAPAAEEARKGLTIEIVFEDRTWIQVYTDGQLQIDGIFPAGATVRAQAGQKLLIHTGNAGGFRFKLNGQPAKPLGRLGQVLTDVKITAENLKDFLEAPSSGLPTG